MKRLMALLVTTCFLTACSNDEATKAELKQILECGMAAKLVGQQRNIDKISDHSNVVARKGSYELTEAEGKKWHAEIKAQWNLKSLSRHDQDELLVNIYNSKACAALHKSARISIEDVPPDA